MHEISKFSLEVAESRRLVLDGRPIDASVEGAILDAQLELDDGRARVWLTDDSPYDEGLHVYLLDREGAVLDAVEAGHDFTPGLLKIEILGTNWVDFSFFNNGERYRLGVSDRVRVRGPLPTGWRYKQRLRRHHLDVSHAKEEEPDG